MAASQEESPDPDVIVLSRSPLVHAFPHFLSDEDCDTLIALARCFITHKHKTVRMVLVYSCSHIGANPPVKET